MSENRNPDGWGQRVAGRCPACGWSSLFVAVGGHVTCAQYDCPNPIAVADALDSSPGDRPQYLVVVPADTARLLAPEVIAALPALLRVLLNVMGRPVEPAANPLPPDIWQRLGEALGGGA